MKAPNTVSRLALIAGVSVAFVRDYLLRGLLRPWRAPRAAMACSR